MASMRQRRAPGAAAVAAAAALALRATLPVVFVSTGGSSVLDQRSPSTAWGRAEAIAPPPAAIPAGSSTPLEGSSASSGLGSVAFAGLCCFLACTAASNRRTAQPQRGLVVCQYFPSACGRHKQKVLRRLEPYGAIPAWSKKPLMKRRLLKPWRKHVTPRPSFYARQQIEKQRVRFHYNVKEKQLQVYVRRAFRKGVEFPIDNFMQQLESRLDNFIWRVGLARTMAGARRFVRQACVQIKSGTMKKYRTVNIPSIRLKIGDKVRIKRRVATLKRAEYMKQQCGEVKIPSHIAWDSENFSGEYLDVCDPFELGMDIEDKYIAMWYSGQRGVRRTHFRYFEGTTVVIKKIYNGGRIRPTPENILNMKRGIGLRQRGRRRPPCLWGRNMPLNNPYYEK